MSEVRHWIEQCRQAFGSPPRRLTWAEQESFRIKPTLLIQFYLLVARDKNRMILRDQDLLRDHGRVVWGYLIQANERLFSPHNRWTLPAVVIYGTDPAFDEDIGLLDAIREEILGIGDTIPGNPAWRQIVIALNNELARAFAVPVPTMVSPHKNVFLSTCLIHPPHLPGGTLRKSFFPLVICPEKTRAAMVLPLTYWPQAMRNMWLEGDG